MNGSKFQSLSLTPALQPGVLERLGSSNCFQQFPRKARSRWKRLDGYTSTYHRAKAS